MSPCTVPTMVLLNNNPNCHLLGPSELCYLASIITKIQNRMVCSRWEMYYSDFVVLLWWNTRQSSSWEETLALPTVLVVCFAPCARGDITAVGACREALLLIGDRTRWRRLGTRHNLQSQAPGDLLKARLHLLMLPGFQCCQLETNYLANKPTGNVLYSNCKGETDTGSWST